MSPWCSSTADSECTYAYSDLPKISGKPSQKDLYPEFLSHFQKKRKDSVMMLAGSQDSKGSPLVLPI